MDPTRPPSHATSVASSVTNASYHTPFTSPPYSSPPSYHSAIPHEYSTTGLGILGYPPSTSSAFRVEGLLPTPPQSSAPWNPSPYSSQLMHGPPFGVPDILSDAFNPFSGIDRNQAALLSEAGFAQLPSTPATLSSSISGFPSAVISQRSSASEASISPGRYRRPPRGQPSEPILKTEAPGDWYSFPSTQPDPPFTPRTSFGTIAPESSLPAQSHTPLAQVYVEPQGRTTRRRSAMQAHDQPMLAVGTHQGEQSKKTEFLTDTSRYTGKKRQPTSPETANHQCPKCGKYFGRKFNFKSHMEIHDPDRAKPYACPAEDCSKKFSRKPDLDRHYDSIHVKQKRFGCSLCGARFARKDTLRRHVEETCPNRYKLRTRTYGAPSEPDTSRVPTTENPRSRRGGARHSTSSQSSRIPVTTTAGSWQNLMTTGGTALETIQVYSDTPVVTTAGY